MGTRVAGWFSWVWMGIVGLILLLPGTGVTDLPEWLPTWLPIWSLPILDKVVHAGLFGVQAALWTLAWEGRASGFGRSRALRSAVAAFLLGAVLESAQLWVPGRFSDPADMLANGVGAVLGAYLPAGWARLRGSRGALEDPPEFLG